jgi:hypothetical protein
MPARYTSETYAEYSSVSATTAQKNSSEGRPSIRSAGMPKPSMEITRMPGSARNRST